MRYRNKIIFASSLIVTTHVMTTFICAYASEQGFYSGKREGWYFYDDPVEEVIEEPKNVALPPTPVQEPTPNDNKVTLPEPKDNVNVLTTESTPKDDDEPLTASAIKTLMPKYLEAAIDEPTEANIARYYLLQKIALDRATEFAKIQQRVVSGNPLLDENTRRPISPFLSRQMNKEATQRKENLIAEFTGRNVGLWFLYDPTKESTFKQAPVVDALVKKHKVTVLPVATKDIPLPNNLFPEYKVNADQIETLGVKSLPAFFLVRLPNQFIPIGEGGLSFTELQDRMLLGAVRAGIITAEEFDRTIPIDNVNNFANANLDDLTVGMTKDPEKFMALMKSKLEAE